MRITFGSLFAGIGGFDLGFERAGMQCKWQVEIDPYCQRVLAKHWPRVPRWDDVRTFPPEGDWAVDVICGGPPCQPASDAGKRKGAADSRWLWDDAIRVIDAIRPKIAIFENPPSILDVDGGRAFESIANQMAEIGFDLEWMPLSAAQFGAPHLRERLFIAAYPHEEGFGKESHFFEEAGVGPQRRRNAYGLDLATCGPWSAMPDVLRVDYGVPGTLDRLGVCGNAVVPQIAEWLGERVVELLQQAEEVARRIG